MIDRKYGIQKINYGFIFKYYDKKGLVRVVPATAQSTRESAESIVDEWIEKIEKVNLSTKEIVDEWARSEFAFYLKIYQ